MTAQERSAQFIAELDEVETMTEDELVAECRRIESDGGFAGCVAGASIRIWEAARAQCRAER